MDVRTFRLDDPALADHLAAKAARPVLPLSNQRPVANNDPRFGAYIQGEIDTPTETKMAERAKKDEVETLPDGRQIQIQAKGAPVNEEMAERERELVKRAHEQKDADHLAELQPDKQTKALSVTGNEKIVDHKSAK